MLLPAIGSVITFAEDGVAMAGTESNRGDSDQYRTPMADNLSWNPHGEALPLPRKEGDTSSSPTRLMAY